LRPPQRRLTRDLRDQVDDIADRGRRFAQAIDIGARFRGGGAGLIGKLAGIAHLRADALGRAGEFFTDLGEAGCGSLCGAAAPAQGLGPLADGGKGRGGRFGATRDRLRRPLKLADQPAKLEVEQLEDFPGRGFSGGHCVDRRGNFCLGDRRSRFRHSFFE
jgi:hypothetical protein